MIKIAPSVLSADFSDMKAAIYQIDYSSAEYVHLDVMDGSFVPEITFGSKLVKDIRPFTDKTFDVHLMVERPENHIEAFSKAGADIITTNSFNANRISLESEGKAGQAMSPTAADRQRWACG